MMKCCFGQRAWIGFGVLAAGLLIADPQAGWWRCRCSRVWPARCR